MRGSQEGSASARLKIENEDEFEDEKCSSSSRENPRELARSSTSVLQRREIERNAATRSAVTHIKELSFSRRAAVRFGALLVKALCATLRYRLIDEAGFLNGVPHPVVMLIWHNRILGMPTLFRRKYPRRKGVLVLTSASRDGAYLEAFVREFRMGSVRGSTSRRGGPALLDLVRKLEAGYDLCITPDGPRGPRYSLSPGAILLAQRCGVPLLPFLVEYDRFWRLKSWDGFFIPKPFSAVTITLLPLIEIPQTVDEEAFEAQRRKVEEAMTQRIGIK